MSEAVRHGEIDQPSGRLLLALLRLAASNIKARNIWEQEAEMQDLVYHVEEDAGFEKEYDLPEGFDLSLDPEVAFPPPAEPTPGGPYIPSVGVCGDDDLRAKFGQILRDAATPIPGLDFQATPEDMELFEVYESKGEKAGLQRALELDRDRKRRERREERKRYEEMARNRNIQLAAQKLVIDQKRTAEEAAMAQPTGAEPSQQNEVGATRKPPQSQGNSSLAEATDVGAGAV